MDNIIALLFLVPVGLLTALTVLAFALRDRSYPTRDWRASQQSQQPRRPVVAAIRILRETEDA